MNIADHLRSMVLSLWLGAALFFSFAVAPNVFVVLRGFDLSNANEIAGTIVTRTLAVINIGGFILALVALLITIALKRRASLIAFTLQVLSLLVLASTTAVGQWLVAARMRALRVAMVSIDLVSPDDPRRVTFTQLHGYSVGLLSTAMLATLIALTVFRLRPRKEVR
jgi:predicted lysophospholipase L1 biosynthesis ABC-type transport system permease subunit